MAHVLIVGKDGRTKLAHLRQHGDVCELERPPAEEHRFSWKVVGIATMALVSAGSWVLILMAARHFLR